jgi:[acyl-carrier-protein] S-malonyltransferase
VEALKAAGVTHVVELGPGRVLHGLVRRITKDIEAHHVEDTVHLEKALAHMGGVS